MTLPCPDLPELVRVFEHIAETRMRGLPLCNPALQVEAVGFERDTGLQGGGSGWLGILVTPWCMNLLWWPEDDRDALPVGEARSRPFGPASYTFIGAHDARLGAFEQCSLFSPMHDFADAATARLVAEHALRALREARSAQTLEAPARRAFLRGRATPAAGL